MRAGLRPRLVAGFVAVSVVTGLVTAAAVVAGVLVLASSHPIGANRVGGEVIDRLPANPSERAIVLSLTLIGLVVVGLAVVSALALARRTLRPVRDLAVAAERIADGDLSTRLVPDGQDEIADLARTFNVMAGNLDRSIDALRRQEATTRRFASDVSHELRSPLAAMTAVTDVLSAHVAEMGPDAARATRLVVEEITHLDRLVADLIEMSRFDAGTVSLDLDVLRVADALSASLALRGWTDRVTVQVQGGLVAVLDRRRFDVIVANLVGNATKYGAPPVVVQAQARGGELVVTVADHGAGLPPTALPHVFERFYKADAARARSDGSGLGLAIARENALLHGGDITVENLDGGGALFTFAAPHRVGLGLDDEAHGRRQ